MKGLQKQSVGRALTLATRSTPRRVYNGLHDIPLPCDQQRAAKSHHGHQPKVSLSIDGFSTSVVEGIYRGTSPSRQGAFPCESNTSRPCLGRLVVPPSRSAQEAPFASVRAWTCWRIRLYSHNRYTHTSTQGNSAVNHGTLPQKDLRRKRKDLGGGRNGDLEIYNCCGLACT